MRGLIGWVLIMTLAILVAPILIGVVRLGTAIWPDMDPNIWLLLFPFALSAALLVCTGVILLMTHIVEFFTGRHLIR